MSPLSPSFLQALQSGMPIPKDHPEFPQLLEYVQHSLNLVAKVNQFTNFESSRPVFEELFGEALHEETTIFTPFYTNFGKLTRIGKGVFINHGCSFLDLGGIYIEDHVLVGPMVQLITENHPLEPSRRSDLIGRSVVLRKKCWIGGGSIVLPGVEIGENAVVAAGTVVTKSVPPNTVVAGNPAKVIKIIENLNIENK